LGVKVKILKLNVRNIKKIKAVDITPQTNFITIGGNNEQGKSSILDSIVYALNGKNAIPEKPIRDGEKEATILVETEDYIIVREFNKTAEGFKTNLKIIQKGEKIVTSPQGELDKFTNKIYDLYNFVKDKEVRYETFLKLAEIDMMKMKDTIRLIEEQRRYIGRDLTQQKAIFSKMSEPETNLPDKEQSNSELVIKLNSFKNIIETENRVKQQISNNENQITEYKLMIQDLESKIRKLEDANNNAQKISFDNVDTKSVENEMVKLDELNEKIRYRNKYSAIENVIQDLHEKYESYTFQRDNYIKEIKEKFNNVMEGLEVDEKDNVKINGIEFEELSQAQQIKVAIEVTCKLNPELKVAIIREGSLIDKVNLEYLKEMADKHNIQIWIEKVGDAEIIIEEGQIKKEDL